MQKNSPGTKVLAGQARNTAASHTIPSSFSYRRTPRFRKKSTMHYYFYWSIIALQHRVGLCYRAEWIRCMFTYVVCLLEPFEPPSYSSGLSQSTKLSSLRYRAASHWHLIQQDTVSMSLLPSQSAPPSPSTAHSLGLCLYSCPENRFITTIFLDSICMH